MDTIITSHEINLLIPDNLLSAVVHDQVCFDCLFSHIVNFAQSNRQKEVLPCKIDSLNLIVRYEKTSAGIYVLFDAFELSRCA